MPFRESTAPFAVVGSIGVVTQIPNFQRFLNEHKVDAYLMTAGNYKRTIDVIGDVTEEGKAKLTEQLDDIHIAFKDHIAFARPKLRETIDEVGTGEHWLAVQGKELGLVDSIMTSDEYLESISSDYDIIEILEKIPARRSPIHMFGDSLGSAAISLRNVAKQIQTTAEGQSPTPMAIV
jgi:serine protease SohB